MSLYTSVTDETFEMPETMAWLRNKRNLMLEECDWTQAADSPLSDSKKAEWATYRQQLRDLTNTYTKENSIEDIVFPTKPT
tara:strand:- start:32063 stop:32305 length:243 start_codon:yes stop_codon:yes gene_type:complete